MVLFSVLGYLAMHFLGGKWMFPAGVILGLIVAPAVPAKTACAIKRPPEDAA